MRLTHFAALALALTAQSAVLAQQPGATYYSPSSGYQVQSINGTPVIQPNWAGPPTMINGTPNIVPGGPMRTGIPYPYANPYANPYRYGYGAYPYGNFPTYAAPVPFGGYFKIGKFAGSYWSAPSGYYYPWGGGVGYTEIVNMPIYYVNQGVSTPSRPPLSAMMDDMEKFLSDPKTQGRLAAADQQRISRRLQDLRNKQDRLMNQTGGALDPGDEESLRKDMDTLSRELAYRLRPGAAKPNTYGSAK